MLFWQEKKNDWLIKKEDRIVIDVVVCFILIKNVNKIK